MWQAYQRPVRISKGVPLNVWRLAEGALLAILFLSAAYSPHDAIAAFGFIAAIAAILGTAVKRWIGV